MLQQPLTQTTTLKDLQRVLSIALKKHHPEEPVQILTRPGEIVLKDTKSVVIAYVPRSTS